MPRRLRRRHCLLRTHAARRSHLSTPAKPGAAVLPARGVGADRCGVGAPHACHVGGHVERDAGHSAAATSAQHHPRGRRRASPRDGGPQRLYNTASAADHPAHLQRLRALLRRQYIAARVHITARAADVCESGATAGKRRPLAECGGACAAHPRVSPRRRCADRAGAAGSQRPARDPPALAGPRRRQHHHYLRLAWALLLRLHPGG